MGLRDRIRTLASAQGAAQPPPYGTSPTTSGSPVDQMLGTTPPEPDPGQIRPRMGPPRGASGRANFYGLPQPDETNAQLIGPQGLRNFDLMYRTDPDVRRLVLAAWSPIVAANWSLQPFGGDDTTDQDRTIADTVWWALNKFMSPNLFAHLTDLGPGLLRWGFYPFEQIWTTTTYQGKTLVLPKKLAGCLPRSIWRWWQDDFGDLTHIGQILPNKPDVVIPATELNYYRLAAEADDNWVGTSLLRHAYKSWVMKDRLERLDAIGQERKAVGVPVVYPPENADDQTRDDVETVFANLHTNEVGYVVMPGPAAQYLKDNAQQGWHVDIITFDSSAGSGIQDSLQYHRQGITSSFLEDFLELGHHQVGARATADVQEDPFLTAVQALLIQGPLPPLQGLVDRIVELNWPTAKGAPEFQVALSDVASLSELATALQQLIMAEAIQIDPELEDWIRERFDMPSANPDIRAARLAAQKAGLENAATAAQGDPLNSNGEPTDSEPPSPNATAGQGESGAASKGQQQPSAQSRQSAQSSQSSQSSEPKPNQNGTKKQLDATDEPTAKWWEQLLSQDKLRDALDGARQHIEATGKAPALTLAQQLAHQAANGNAQAAVDTQPLADALTKHFEDMYQLGHDTVRDELARQRQTMQLAGPSDIASGIAASAGSTRRSGA